MRRPRTAILASAISMMPGCFGRSSTDTSGTGSSDNDDASTDSSMEGFEAEDEAEDEADTGAELCGNETCTDTEFCDWSANLCGDTDVVIDQPRCAPKPGGCDDVFAPVCGCNQEVYGNACLAEFAGVDLSEVGPCPEPPAVFRCGFAFCDQDSSYCEKNLSYTVGVPNDFRCVALPAGCQGIAGCECLEGEVCGDNCTALESGHYELTCVPGP